MFVCSEVVANVCQSWVPLASVFGFESGDGLKLGGLLLLLTATAWGLKVVAKMILNR